MSYLSTDLAAAVQRRAAIPASQSTFSPTALYALGDEEIRSKLVPLVCRNIEDFYTQFLDYPITAGQAAYNIPTRAIAGALRDVQIIQASDTESRTPLERLAPEDLYSSVGGNYRFTIKKTGFYLQGNQVMMYPAPTMTSPNLLRLSYYCRPNQLVDPTACGQILSINTSTNTVVLASSAPSTFTTASALDFIGAKPHFDWLIQDAVPASIGTTTVANDTLVFSVAIPSALAVGDYVCLSGQSCVVQVPVELQPLLIQYVTVRVLSAQGDQQALQAAIAELGKLEENAILLIAPRVVGKSKRATNTRGISRFV